MPTAAERLTLGDLKLVGYNSREDFYVLDPGDGGEPIVIASEIMDKLRLRVVFSDKGKAGCDCSVCLKARTKELEKVLV